MKQTHPWRRNTSEGRWYGFGRYYAMFPPRFAYDAIDGLTRRGERVLDPFCGRGNGPFTATVLGRESVGIDVNPLAWLFTASKLKPAGVEQVLDRLMSIGRAARARDRKGRSRFERMAWAPAVRSFLRAARRELNWQTSRVDRTLMGFVTLHMQDKLGAGLSNALWPTIACSPGYAVRWWTKAGLVKAPDVDPVAILADKIRRRYECGRPTQANGTALLGDARQELRDADAMEASLLLTSPPYIGVTDYWNDHWIRLWMLGHPLRKGLEAIREIRQSGRLCRAPAERLRPSAKALEGIGPRVDPKRSASFDGQRMQGGAPACLAPPTALCSPYRRTQRGRVAPSRAGRAQGQRTRPLASWKARKALGRKEPPSAGAPGNPGMTDHRRIEPRRARPVSWFTRWPCPRTTPAKWSNTPSRSRKSPCGSPPPRSRSAPPPCRT